MPFFIRKKTTSKGKTKSKKDKKKVISKRVRTAAAEVPAAKRARPADEDDEEIDSDEFEDEPAPADEPDLSETELETAQEKRLRLAKLYLEEIKRQEAGREEAEEVDRAGRSVADRLRDEVLERAGRLQRPLADSCVQPAAELVRRLRCRQLQLPVTCAVLAPDDKFLYTGSKDCSLIKWCMETYKRLQVVPGGRKGTENTHIGHTTHILCMAISTDNKYLVSGDLSHLIQLWDPASLTRLHVFRGHRGAVTGLAFQRGTHQLFSAAADRMVKVWSVHDRSYIESLFGHQDAITGLDALSRERAVSCGGRDTSCRVWKLVEESQLVFTGHRDSIDCIRLINEEHWVTGGQDGMVCLWGVSKKKPLCCVPRAHGVDPQSRLPRWVSAVSALTNSDLVASGSWDGHVRLWRCAAGFTALTALMALPAAGFVNSLTFSGSGDRLVAGCGQEHRLGRWWRLREGSNQLLVYPLTTAAQQQHTDSSDDDGS
ncbi:U3 small nucleolar RNA-interacting protein 2-like [Amphibalanus amphitrite]|uniref:U3 small nucleolar RNA-interacting protein 2-like n=1 Tax=Amphibalanus amphitrite TaxID=1232801 RepID=UPI001C912153|nr:U3 small nucleolar RNA-interacting protein 2-like [Amphibalanus amphitrite]